ncbi:MAG: Hsp20/alpha crystallin family protein [Candidatus Competibacteraceae bacterium]|nr:Hsp20/alpha crystallin family protein [Candidatus Competibacteraceae bacterium]
MAITRHDPWSRLNQLAKDLDRMFEMRQMEGDDNSQVVTCDWVPAVDIKEEPARFVLHADIPGVDPKDIEITMERGILTLRGERKAESTTEQEGFRRVERSHGTFYRRFSLPDSADAERISARGSNGVLEIVIPKQERTQPRKITVES